jgi:hypothetical protein
VCLTVSWLSSFSGIRPSGTCFIVVEAEPYVGYSRPRNAKKFVSLGWVWVCGCGDTD